MTTKLSRRGLLRSVLAGASLASLPGLAGANAPLQSLRPMERTAGLGASAGGGVSGLVSRAGLKGEVICAVADVDTGLRLEELNGQNSLPPASVAKALTALYALETLGSDYRFETRVLATGPVEGGVLKGDLVLQGGGDPTLSTNHLALLAAAVKAKGIREVRGAFRVDDTALPYVKSIDAEQPDHVGYSPAVSGIALNFNRVHFEWKRGSKGYSVSMDARTEKYRPEVQTATMKVVKRSLPVYTYASKDGVDSWTVAQSALGKGGSRWLPVRKPAEYAGDVFRTMMRAHGIPLDKAKVGKSSAGTVLVRHHSAPLPVLLRGMLKHSNNLTAEMIGMTATVRRTGSARSLKHSATEMSTWAARHYGMSRTKLVDHSGLGDASRMAPDDLVGALIKVRKTGMLRPLLKPFPMRDARGKVNKAHPIKVDAKTGTLNFVSGLGGFMTAADGTELAFAIFIADVDRRARIKRADREVPQGARQWNRSAKQLQQKLIERWGALYGS